MLIRRGGRISGWFALALKRRDSSLQIADVAAGRERSGSPCGQKFLPPGDEYLLRMVVEMAR